MADRLDRHDMQAAVLDCVGAAAAGDAPPVQTGYLLGWSGVRADLAVAADEFIGVLIRTADDALDDIEGQLAVCARYFDRVALVVAPAHLPALDGASLAGAALWTIGHTGELFEHAPGRRNAVSPSALFDLMPFEQRARLLRPLVPSGSWRGRSAPSEQGLAAGR